MDNPLVSRSDIMSHLAEFVHDKQYLFFVSVSRGWRDSWGQRPKFTAGVTPDMSVSQLSYSIACGLGRQFAVCRATAKLGRLDLLLCARDHDLPWGESTCSWAAFGGHLDVLQYA